MNVYLWIVIVSVFWVTLLAANISRLRMKEQVGLGDGGKLSIKKAIRAHVNALEHVVPFCMITYVLEVSNVSNMVLVVLAVVFFVSRLMHVYSLAYSVGSLRRSSASLTYLCLLVAVVLAVVKLV